MRLELNWVIKVVVQLATSCMLKELETVCSYKHCPSSLLPVWMDMTTS